MHLSRTVCMISTQLAYVCIHSYCAFIYMRMLTFGYDQSNLRMMLSSSVFIPSQYSFGIYNKDCTMSSTKC